MTKGIVTGIKAINLKELEDVSKRNNCLAFLKNFLNEVKDKLKDVDDPRKVYCFKWNQKHGKVETFLDENNIKFLTDDYVNFVNNLN